MINVIARRGSVHYADDRNLVETWDFFDHARLGELVLRFTKASFRPTINGTHAWLLRIVHDAEAVQNDEDRWEWKATGEEQDSGSPIEHHWPRRSDPAPPANGWWR